jgi:multidrug resistance protein MdtO
MATVAQSSPQASQSSRTWLFSFLKEEFTPYPGRGWTVTRMTIAATLVMLWIMTFRIPGAALGAYYTLLVSRDSPQATLKSASSSIAAIGCALCIILFSAAILIGDPLLHFFWVIGLLFLAFFLISALAEYRLALSFGFLVVTSLAYWDFPANTETRVENTLWTTLAFAVAALVTIAVEFVSQRVRGHDQLRDGLRNWIAAAQSALDAWGNRREVDPLTRRKLLQYGMIGGGRFRLLLARGEQNPQLRAEMSATVALVERLVDLIGATVDAGIAFGDEDAERFLAARDDLQAVKEALNSQDLEALGKHKAHAVDASSPFLLDIQRTIALLPQVFAGLGPLSESLPSAVDLQKSAPLWKRDAFTAPDHLHFALKGTLAAGLCYIVYNAIDWPGLNTALSTCILTAVSTVGSSRQKQLLRVLGALFGAVCLGMSAQVFLLPHLIGITGFSLLFAFVTALSAWVATASPRLSFAGLQTAFAFYITQLRTFGPQTSLSVARDDVAGILLGLGAMWLCFDRIWVKDTAAYVMGLFIDNLRRMADFSKQIASCRDVPEAIDTARSERNIINARFDLIRNENDALIFEFGTNWQRKVKLRNQIRAWQPPLRTYFLLEISLMHYRLQEPERKLPDQEEQCIQASKELLHRLADWKETSLKGSTAEPPEALVELLRRSKMQAQASKEQMGDDRNTQGISSSMLNIAVRLAQVMLSETGSASL